MNLGRMTLAVLLSAAFAAGQQQEVGRQCSSCHVEHVEELRTHRHAAKGLTCEVCHGASQQHRLALGATSPDRVAAPDEVPALCGSCHTAQKDAYARSKHAQVLAAQSKVKSANCGTCHGVHAPRDVAAMQRQCDRCHAELPASCRKTAAGAEKLACARCHNPHTLAQ